MSISPNVGGVSKMLGSIVANPRTNALREQVKQSYQEQLDIRYAAARGWVDGIIAPETTRDVLRKCLKLVARLAPGAKFHTGVLQV